MGEKVRSQPFGDFHVQEVIFHKLNNLHTIESLKDKNIAHNKISRNKAKSPNTQLQISEINQPTHKKIN
jgi:hypothetical protein